MTDARQSAEVGQIALADVAADARESSQVVSVVVLPNASALLSSQVVQVAVNLSLLSPVTADSSAITISESSSIVVGIFVSSTDTAAITITEEVIPDNPSSADSAAITITESSNTVAVISATDTTAVNISETSDVQVAVTSTETIAISIIDLNSPDGPIAMEFISVNITESTDIFSSLSRTDTAAITISDASINLNNPNPSDTAAITVSETSSILVTSSASDSVAISIASTYNLVGPPTDSRLSSDVVQTAMVVDNVSARLSSNVVQVAIRIDSSTVRAKEAAQITIVALQIRRGTLSIHGGKRQDMIDGHERKYVYGMSKGPPA